MSRASLKVNGQVHAVDVDLDGPLLYVLRDDLTLNNPRFPAERLERCSLKEDWA